MKALAAVFSLGLAVIGLVGGVACAHKTDDETAACVRKVPPPGAAIMRLQLSRVDFGAPESNGGSSVPSRPIGFDLDGVCGAATGAATSSLSCKPRSSTSASYSADGEQGIDNAFAKIALPLLTRYAGPNELTSRPSYLQVDAGGSGILRLVATNGFVLRVPLVDVRVASNDGRTGTLGARVPLATLTATLREDVGVISELLCSGASFDGLLADMTVGADVLSTGAVDPAIECDGLSLGMTFEGTPVGEPPPVPPTRCPSDAGSDG